MNCFISELFINFDNIETPVKYGFRDMFYKPGFVLSTKF